MLKTVLTVALSFKLEFKGKKLKKVHIFHIVIKQITNGYPTARSLFSLYLTERKTPKITGTK